MIEPRLATQVRIDWLRRKMAEAGEFAVIVHRGDPVSGALLVLALEKGENPRLVERMPSLDGSADWQLAWHQDFVNKGKSDSLDAYIERRRLRDPDLWVIELDTADHAQLDALLTMMG